MLLNQRRPSPEPSLGNLFECFYSFYILTRSKRPPQTLPAEGNKTQNIQERSETCSESGAGMCLLGLVVRELYMR